MFRAVYLLYAVLLYTSCSIPGMAVMYFRMSSQYV
jgi:hypothetical protein